MDELLKYLSAGGNISTIALLYIMWRFDRRIVRIEAKLGLPEGKS